MRLMLMIEDMKKRGWQTVPPSWSEEVAVLQARAGGRQRDGVQREQRVQRERSSSPSASPNVWPFGIRDHVFVWLR